MVVGWRCMYRIEQTKESRLAFIRIEQTMYIQMREYYLSSLYSLSLSREVKMKNYPIAITIDKLLHHSPKLALSLILHGGENPNKSQLSPPAHLNTACMQRLKD